MKTKKGKTGMSGCELIQLEEIQTRIYTIRRVQVMEEIEAELSGREEL